jgi:hypothetical protein
MEHLAILIGFIVVVFVFVAFIVLSDTVKGPEKFAIRVVGDTPQITSLEIFDATNKSLFYYSTDNEDGEKKMIIVPDCAAFILSWENGDIAGVGPFVAHDGRVVKTVVGKMTDNYELYSNTDQIKRR